MSVSKNALSEALALSNELLRNIELNELPLANIALKSSRLARLLGEFNYQRIFSFEASGYTTTPDGVPPDVYSLAVIAGREYLLKDAKSGEVKKYIYTMSLEELEMEIVLAPTALDAARDAPVSVSSANPYQTVYGPSGNKHEREKIVGDATEAKGRLANRRSFIHQYVIGKYYELKFSGVADDIFSRIRHRVDAHIGSIIPESTKKFSSVYDNLQSDNSEDWSNAVHSCRRILQDLANAICPPQADVVKSIKSKSVTVKLGQEEYINRIIHFIESKSSSKRFKSIVGSNLQFVGNRLDGVFQAAQKGSHDIIVSREEADRYVAYTYMLIGDIISLV